ncbi:MAG: hypothetical protein V1877_01305 [Candidatus Tagabacteria bacterium]
MLTNEDIKKLKQELVNKEDLSKLLTREEFGEFRMEVKENFAALRESIQALTVAVDKLAKSVEDLREEYLAIVTKVDRHEKWFHQIADKVGIKLEY